MAIFQARARAVDILGDKQVADSATAISELFKNAHDADAFNAELAVDTDHKSILLWDDGHGMTYEDVTDKWLTLGTDSKLGDDTTPVRRTRLLQRITMGEKGIGRLAVAALGSQTLMVTKARREIADGENPKWVGLYLHWDVFENGQMALNDLQIPVIEMDSLAELQPVALELIEQFEQNLVNEDPRITQAWARSQDLRSRILDDINRLKRSLGNIHGRWNEVLSEVESRDYGTLFLIHSLKENWKIIGADSNQGLRKKRKKDNLAKTLSFFSNPMEKLDASESPEHNLSFAFVPKVTIDERSVLSEFKFEEADLNHYDFGIVGHIDRKGVFHGQFLVQDGDTVEHANLDLTGGIDPEEATACGDFHLRVYHVEGDLYNTRLPDGIWSQMYKKLEAIGGVYLYRDGMRVLPYGSHEFDFLGWEEARNRNAGRWVLNVRRAFGYISISKEQNPKLVDKSSREGLRTNKEYEFFLACLRNLFTTWMQDFIHPLRKEVVAATKEIKERERQERKQKTEFEQEVKHYRRQLAAAIEDRQGALLRQAARFQELLSQEIGQFTETHLPTEYPLLTTLLQDLERRKGTLEDQLRRYHHEWQIEADERYAGDNDVTVALSLHREWVTSKISGLREQLANFYNAAKTRMEAQVHAFLIRLTNRTGNNTPEQLIRDLQSFVGSARRDIDLTRRKSTEDLKQQLRVLHENYRDTLQELGRQAQGREKEVLRTWEPQVEACFSPVMEHFIQLEELLKQVLRGDGDTAHSIREIHALVDAVRADLNLALEHADQIIQRARQAGRVASLEALSHSVKELDRSDWHLVGQLNSRLQEMSAQLEEYRHLVMTGIAAEIVNHEFDDQYRLIYDLFETPRVKKTFKQVPELERLKILFEHLENRHRLLSPLYRRTRLTRIPIKLNQVGSDIEELFESRLEEADIELVNAIDSTWTIRESESIIYPVFVNLINNSIYWLLNRDVKQIRLRSNVQQRALYIEDTGPGIAPDRAEQIFDLFYSTRPGGRGIGLSLVRELLDSRNHQITLVTDPDERSPDFGGACFRIQFAPEAIV